MSVGRLVAGGRHDGHQPMSPIRPLTSDLRPLASSPGPPTSDPCAACRLIIDEPVAGSWNMSVDEALLEAAIGGGPATLRLYQWSEPTLSLGYFQRYDDRRSHAASRDSAVVRRSSGGGAILHDRELTYSLTLPAGHRLARNAAALYSVVHRLFLQVLTLRLATASAGWRLQIVPARQAAAGGSRRPADAEPFLCFQRRSPGDVLLVPAAGTSATPLGRNQSHAWKIVGSAQRRRGGAILQHGSVLLERSPAAPELPGYSDLADEAISFAALAEEFTTRFSAELAVDVAATSLPDTVCDAARQIEREKYANQAWTTRR